MRTPTMSRTDHARRRGVTTIYETAGFLRSGKQSRSVIMSTLDRTLLVWRS